MGIGWLEDARLERVSLSAAVLSRLSGTGEAGALR